MFLFWGKGYFVISTWLNLTNLFALTLTRDLFWIRLKRGQPNESSFFLRLSKTLQKSRSKFDAFLFFSTNYWKRCRTAERGKKVQVIGKNKPFLCCLVSIGGRKCCSNSQGVVFLSNWTGWNLWEFWLYNSSTAVQNLFL